VKQQHTAHIVEFTVGPHPGRPGWKTARISYDPRDSAHQQQVQAALSALIREQGVVEQEMAPPPSDRRVPA
jgi:hypothetical protein